MSAASRQPEREWVGGCITPPFFVTDRPEPYRMALALWLEMPDGLIVGQAAEPEDQRPGLLGRALGEALEEPLVGPARRPARLRVSTNALAREAEEAVGDSIPIVVAPTPEIDELLQAMLESMPAGDEEPGYLEDGRVPEPMVARLFAAARALYALKPWETAGDDQVLRIDIPALGIDGACLSVIGALGESFGVIIFSSLDDYEAFGRSAEAFLSAPGSLDLGAETLAVTFDRGADLPMAKRREVMAHGWPVAGADAYPVVERRERDGAIRPLVERDVAVATACVTALTTFCVRHGSWFEAEVSHPVCESYRDENDLEVRVTAPYEAFPAFDVAGPSPPERARRAVGRNDPCPCGSGRKYKKCHLPLDEAQHSDARRPDRFHELDAALVERLSRFAVERFGVAWWQFQDDFDDLEAALQLAVPWSVYGYAVDGRTIVDAYLGERGARCSAAERAWLMAQQAAWLSVWEVTEVEPGEGVTLTDLLSLETRRVREVSGSTTLVIRDALLARVVDHEDVSLLCGAHPRPLPPREAAEVVRRARGRLRRRAAVPPDRLRPAEFGCYLIRRWEEAVAALDARVAVPPELCNTDGDALLLTTDHYRMKPGSRQDVERRLEALEGVQPPEPIDDDLVYVVLHADAAGGKPGSGEQTVIGRVLVSASTLRIETNSRERADALRARVERACGDRIRHRAREHVDPLSRLDEAPAGPPLEPADPALDEIVMDFKRRHYADWPDCPLPALDGQTPRQAARSKQGRAALDVLLKEMENTERRALGRAAFDFSGLRRELGLE